MHMAGTDVQKALEQSNDTFKPGPEYIFRMNQNKFESEIRRIHQDSTLDPMRKSCIIQDLMTSRWIATQQQQKLPQARIIGASEDENLLECSTSFHDPDEQIFGCNCVSIPNKNARFARLAYMITKILRTCFDWLQRCF